MEPLPDGEAVVIVKLGALTLDKSVPAGIPALSVIVQVNKAPAVLRGAQVGAVVMPLTVAPVTLDMATPAGNWSRIVAVVPVATVPSLPILKV